MQPGRRYGKVTGGQASDVVIVEMITADDEYFDHACIVEPRAETPTTEEPLSVVPSLIKASKGKLYLCFFAGYDHAWQE